MQSLYDQICGEEKFVGFQGQILLKFYLFQKGIVQKARRWWENLQKFIKFSHMLA